VQLTAAQAAALAHVSSIARAASAAALPRLRARTAALGLGPAVLERTLLFIRDTAPLIIHFRPELLSAFAASETYRNQFETGTSSGTLSRVVRSVWEDSLFGKTYAAAADSERVKYGVLNITGDSRGVVLAHNYGQCYLALKEPVRARATFSNRDSAGLTDAGLSTCESYAHVLDMFNEVELKSTLEVGGGRSSFRGTAGPTSATYKEAQIHGPVRFKQDVSAVVVPEFLRAAFEAQAQAFAAAHRLSLLWV
jgi:hypothetical protein